MVHNINSHRRVLFVFIAVRLISISFISGDGIAAAQAPATTVDLACFENRTDADRMLAIQQAPHIHEKYVQLLNLYDKSPWQIVV